MSSVLANIIYGPNFDEDSDIYGITAKDFTSVDLNAFRDMCEISLVSFNLPEIRSVVASEGSQIHVIKTSGFSRSGVRLSLSHVSNLTRVVELKDLRISNFPVPGHELLSPGWYYVQWKTWHINEFDFGEYGFFIKRDLIYVIMD